MYRRDPLCHPSRPPMPPLRHSNTPSLRVAGFEDEEDEEDEYEAPGEMRSLCLQAGGGSQTTPCLLNTHRRPDRH
jgi:hypothetical protein